jgi:hypothetical protein
MKVQQNYLQYVMHWDFWVCFVIETSVIGYPFVLMQNNKLTGNTDGVWRSLGTARLPNYGRTHLSRHIALGRCEDPPVLGLSPKGGEVASNSG